MGREWDEPPRAAPASASSRSDRYPPAIATHPHTIAVVGPGAIGRAVLVELARADQTRVVACGRREPERAPLLWPDGAHDAPFDAHIDPAAAPAANWVLVATKAHQSAATATWFEHLRASGAPVAVLQNGVEHIARFEHAIPRDALLPVIVNGPVQRTPDGTLRVPLGLELVAPNDALGASFAALFTATSITVRLVDDWQSEAWRKLALNAARAVGALLNEPARCFQDEPVAALARAFALEALAVARAEGAPLPDALADDIVAHVRRLPPDSVDSLHADLLAGRPTEIDAKSGAVVRLGARHGIATPLNALAVTAIERWTARGGR